MPEMSSSFSQSKSVMRQSALNVRGEAHRALGPDAADAIADHFLADVLGPWQARRGQADVPLTIAGYFPIRSEADPLPLLNELGRLGHICALPRVVEAEEPLTFHVWEPGSATKAGPFGTRVPDRDAPQILPEIVLVPLLSFDLKGMRLGYGGGFYDRTLEKIRQEKDCLAVGIAFSAQERDQLPHDRYDQALDWVVTEVGCRRFERTSV
jgi:5-formyltetrahydrofolate cyclo-ligase